MTANDAPNRDPVKWTLEGSNDGSSWSVVDDTYAGSAFSAPNGRYEWAGPFCLTSEGGGGGGGGGAMGGTCVDDICGTVTQVSTDGPGTTYQLGLILSGNAKNVYTIFGLNDDVMLMPPAYQVRSWSC